MEIMLIKGGQVQVSLVEKMLCGCGTLGCPSDPTGRQVIISPVPETSPPPPLIRKRGGKEVISGAGRTSGAVAPPCDVKEELCRAHGAAAVQRIRTALNKVVARTELRWEGTAK